MTQVEPRRYVHSGLAVTSDISLPELEPSGGETSPDIRVVLDPACGALEQREERIEPGRCRFTVPATASYDVRGGREITIRPAPAAAREAVRLFLLGSAWAALLQQRGSLAMHAAAVQVDDGAVAFCGPRSAGKSSTAAWLLRHGHAFLSDDLCRVDVADDHARVYPSAPRLKLSGDAIEASGWTTRGLSRELPSSEKFHIPWRGRRAREPLPLRTIYLLEWGSPGASRLTGVAALRRFLRAATYRPGLLEPATALARHWELCADLVRRVPVWELRRPRSWSGLDRTMRDLAASW